MVEHEHKDLFYKDHVKKDLHIYNDSKTINITNTELWQEKFELEECLCSEYDLTFGACQAGSVEFTVSNIFNSMVGEWLTVDMILNGDFDKPLTIGKYKVISDTPAADRTCRSVVAYDALYDVLNSDVYSWYDKLSFPLTMKEFRNKFFSYFGIKQEDISLANDSMVIEKTVSTASSEEESGDSINEEMSGAEVLSCICEVNGCLGNIGRNGKFRYVYLESNIHGLYPSKKLYPSKNLYPKNPKTNKLRKNTYTAAQYEDYEVQEITKLQIRQEENDIGVIVGTGDNSYIIEGNFLVYGKGTEELTNIANNVLNKIKGKVYRPFSGNFAGNPCLEIGDSVSIPTKYQIIESYVLKRTLKGIQMLSDEYETTGNQQRDNNTDGIQRSIIMLKGRSNLLKRTIEETQSTIQEVEKNVKTQITQTAENITSEASKTYSTKEEAKGYAENAENSANKSTDEKLKEYITVVEAETKINQSAEDVTISANKTAKTYAAEAENAANKSTDEKLKEYSTTTEMRSELQVTAEGINTEVLKKVNSDEIVSKINQSAEKVQIEAKKINLVGAVTAEDIYGQSLTGIGLFGCHGDFTSLFLYDKNADLQHGSLGGQYVNPQTGEIVQTEVFRFNNSILGTVCDVYQNLYFMNGAKPILRADVGLQIGHTTIGGNPVYIPGYIKLNGTTKDNGQSIMRFGFVKDESKGEEAPAFELYDNYTKTAHAITAKVFGNLQYTGSLSQTSSRKYKENINELSEEEAKKILNYYVVTFDYKNGKSGCHGMIAEDAAEISEYGIVRNSDGEPEAISYVDYIPDLIKLTQSLFQKIEILENRVNVLEGILYGNE